MNYLVSIISVSLLFLFSIVYKIKSYIYNIYMFFYQSLFDFYILLFCFSEDKYIQQSRLYINYPKNIGIILSKKYDLNIIINALLNFIKWSIQSKIAHINIYDLLCNFITKSDYDTLIHILNNTFKNNNIILSYCEDNKKRNIKCIQIKNINNINSDLVQTYNYDLSVSIINYTNANITLIENLVKKDLSYPIEITPFFKDSYSTRFNKKCIYEYEKYYTRKHAEGIPELIITFAQEELCLYGFPFTLLENCELKKCRNDITDLCISEFINIFDKYSHTNKRFGK